MGYKGLEFYSKVFKDKALGEQEKFVELVKKKVVESKMLLDRIEYFTNDKTDVLLIVSPDISNVNINSNLAIAGKNDKYRDMEFEADSWLKSRSSRKPQNYLVIYAEDRYIVFIVTEYILLVHYGLLISDSIIYDEKDCQYNEEKFIKRLSEIGLRDVTIIAKEEFPEKYFEKCGMDEKHKILRAYFEVAGKLLIAQKATDENGERKENWTDERMSSSILGYNDAQQLIVFAWNTPTYTLTPLWLQEKINDTEWIPLFPRIDK